MNSTITLLKGAGDLDFYATVAARTPRHGENLAIHKFALNHGLALQREVLLRAQSVPGGHFHTCIPAH